jgi:hypothetical protein
MLVFLAEIVANEKQLRDVPDRGTTEKAVDYVRLHVSSGGQFPFSNTPRQLTSQVRLYRLSMNGRP